MLKSRNFLLDLIFPIECLGCAKDGTWLCNKCFRSLPINNRQFCPGCSRANKNSNYCAKCAPDYFLNGIWVASNYNNQIVANLIKKLKYSFVKDLSAVLSQLLILYFTQLLGAYRLNYNSNKNLDKELDRQLKIPLPILWLSNTIVISIPLHKKRLRWRGFNQAEIIAVEFCQHFNLDLRSDLLIRKKHTAAQMKLKKKKRLKNLLSAFEYKGNNLKNRPIILIDDVATTGSTLNECAKILKQNGASEVWGLVVAHG